MTANQENIIKQLDAIVKDATTSSDEMTALLHLGSQSTLTFVTAVKLKQAADTLNNLELPVPREATDKMVELRATQSTFKTKIQDATLEAIEHGKQRDWLMFISHYKSKTMHYDKVDSYYDLVYTHLTTDVPATQHDGRILQTYILRHVVKLLDQPVKLALYKHLVSLQPHVTPSEYSDISHFKDHLGISADVFGDGGMDIPEYVQPFVAYMKENVTNYSDFLEETLEHFEELKDKTMTKTRLNALADSYVMKFGLVDSNQEDKKMAYEKEIDKMLVHLKKVFKGKYLDI